MTSLKKWQLTFIPGIIREKFKRGRYYLPIVEV
ncbi:MAG: hypothetical protein PWP31_130 [Clostridia bacterium]|nr:hypothetical protein [Clostridia bacterium]